MLRVIRVVALAVHDLAWTLAGRGAARGRTERHGLVVELTADTGAIGRGEASPVPGMSPDRLADARAALAALHAPFELAAEPAAVFERAAGVAAPSARFAIETALLELVARTRGVTIAELFEPAGDPRLAAAFARIREIVAGDPAVSLELSRVVPTAVVVDDPAAAAAAVREGARCLKLKLGELPIADDVARVRAIAAAAPTARLRLDANRRWSRADVPAHLARLAGLPIDFVEEPCPDAHALLDGAPLALPIALDESLATLAPDLLFAALAAPGLGAVVLKPTLLGGYAACLAIAHLARLAGKPAIVTHALEHAIGFAACVELARIVGGEVAHGVAPVEPVARTTTSAADEPRARPPGVIVAEPSLATVATVWKALEARHPLALVHHALPEAERARRRALVERAELGGDDAVVLFTSGSTSDGRGVVLSRAALEAAAAASAAHLEWHAGDAWFVPLSLAHAGGLAAVVRCWLARRPVELLDGDWDRARAAALLERCTLASLVPTQLADLLADPGWRPPGRLRAVLLGGAAAGPALLARAAARGVPFLASYGMTESFGQLATAPLARAGDPAAPLVALPGVELAGGTREAPAALRVRAPMLATRYLDGEPIAPELVTRDLGFVERGAVVVVGRADDVIVSGGENVHPATVEAVLAGSPGVRAAIVFPVPDERWGQLVGAAIAADHAPAAAVLAAWHAALPAHARPRELAVVAALPLTATGKPDRRAAARLPRVPVRYP